MSYADFLAAELAGHPVDWPDLALPDGGRLSRQAPGVVLLEPATPATHSLLLSAGIHGDETAPIELLDSLLSAVSTGKLTVRIRVLFVLGNLAAMRQGRRYIAQDLNRLFGKQALEDSLEAHRANQLCALSQAFFDEAQVRIHYDLHTTIRESKFEKFAIQPLPKNAGYQHDAWLAAAGMQAIVLHNEGGHTYTAFTQEQCGAQSYTLELGKARPFGQNQALDLSALKASLQALLAGNPAAVTASRGELRTYRVFKSVLRRSKDFELYLDKDCENFAPVSEGYRLYRQDKEFWCVDRPGARVLFPNSKVALGLRAALLLVPCTSSGEQT